MSPDHDVPSGVPLPAREHRHSRIQLFRFSAATWNSHRIHYDVDHARSEGHRDVVVQSTLHGEMLARRAVEVAGPGATVVAVEWRNEATAVAEDALRWEGEQVAATPDPTAPGHQLVEVSCRIVRADGTVVARGTVEVRRPVVG